MVAAKNLSGLDVRGLTSDSRKVEQGFLFAAIAGSKTDGARFLKDAVAKGAGAVLGRPELADDARGRPLPAISFLARIRTRTGS